MTVSEGINRTGLPGDRDEIISCAGRHWSGRSARQAAIADFPARPHPIHDLGTRTIPPRTLLSGVPCARHSLKVLWRKSSRMDSGDSTLSAGVAMKSYEWDRSRKNPGASGAPGSRVFEQTEPRERPGWECPRIDPRQFQVNITGPRRQQAMARRARRGTQTLRPDSATWTRRRHAIPRLPDSAARTRRHHAIPRLPDSAARTLRRRAHPTPARFRHSDAKAPRHPTPAGFRHSDAKATGHPTPAGSHLDAKAPRHPTPSRIPPLGREGATPSHARRIPPLGREGATPSHP